MIKLAVPQNPLYDRFVANSEHLIADGSVQIIRDTESKCTKLVKNNIVSAAFLSPLGYGSGIPAADFRIIPGPCLSAEAYTEIAGLYFNSGLKTLETLATNSKDDFIAIIGLLLLAEKYSLEPELKEQSGSPAKLLAMYDSAITLGKITDMPTPLDVTEEWFDAFELELPIGMWVCKSEELPHNIVETISEIAGDIPLFEDVFESDSSLRAEEHRQGRIKMLWNEDTEHALEQTLQFLFFHQYINEIPAVKVLGRD